MSTAAFAPAGFADALAQLPADALPAPLAQLWLARAQAGAPMRDRPEVLADTLAILATLNADAEVLAAALLDALVDVQAQVAEAAIALPERLRALLEGQRAASRVWALHRDHGGGRNPEGMRRLLLALVRDLRVIPIVLARQLSRMRAAWRLPAAEQQALAAMTRDIHAPLANRLGIWQLKWELEDLAFRILQPADYQRIARSLDDSRAGRERYIDAVLRQLRQALAAQGVRADVAGRPKHIYSIWKKMQRKGLPIEELYDLRAVRVLVEDIPACYAVLGLVHALWVPIPSEFDDYIARPKPNGYCSLHTAVIGPEGKTLEVQIRTREMHAQSELGVAAHWRYKEGGSAGGAAMDKRIAWMRKLLEQAADAAGAGDPSPLQGIDSELVEDRVYALTPKGEVVDLPQGATVLDFAYAIHSMVGHRCRGAKVDGRIVPLTHVLRTGERVEILTGKTPEPRRDWLQPSAGFLASSRSREKVRAWFNKLDRAHNIEEGRALLERDLRRLGLLHADLAPVLARFNLHSEDDLLVAVALGDITSAQAARALQEADKPASSPEPALPAAPPRAATPAAPGAGVVTVQGVDNLLVQVARCCQPLPGEAITGYLTRTRGVSVHRPDCAAFLRLAGKEPARVLPVEWGRAQAAQEVALRIEAVDRKWLLKDITTLLAQLGVNVLGLHTDPLRAGAARVRIRLQARIVDFEQLGLLLARLESLPGVESARRA
ncbi:bifunctional (p)ppGpp synthetase/guanosine-3',5'-bis(diphosphate) 3'-pyrophosphohydrolase [Thermomonas sp. S9]|uniref:RelA/SpoT family protein n=1 Tax=Thermomonas sp. S9 TaxID=2885203 RepID=UPI00216B14A7|nr:bifunctional (p)ppGpp synthetase/guanosine-3',5'-bis(diphosphate) 3'-pyrophosphohydrolase [Thermomonas sp. S9]MCR6497265.1 bifunctional (p)ppGpp synthetase/guanosine-3',5'-bis(diphosphate) 3'-pyrophosphohydrolase [Thermomonas sp. S9]